eukprot:GAFH01001101.1.p1 GENE.GAFH01001101.1~~GAFH01001101.1.p1  ORF type:complete len:549 (-),score=203.73 GAFH01001101.1:326-1903(-)
MMGQDVVFKNISAINELSAIHRTCMGPHGQSKLVVTHLGRTLISRRTSTIVENLAVEHPAAKLVVMAANHQATEVGDGTTFVITLAGEILEKVKPFLEMRLSIKDLVEGLDMAMRKTLEILPELAVFSVPNVVDIPTATRVIKCVIGTKMNGYEHTLAPLVAQACADILPSDPKKFLVENVRVAKVLGGNIADSSVIRGFCLTRDTEGTVKHIRNAKLAVFGCAVDKDEGETKGTITISNADELKNYSVGEEQRMKQIIDDVARTGANVIVTGATFGEIAEHFIEAHGMMAIKVPSKFDLRRLCLATGATALVRLGAPTAEEMGHCAAIDAQEVGGTRVLVLSQEGGSATSRISTILVRAATQNTLDEIEKVIEDGVNVFKTMTRDQRFLAGAGACEMELSHRLEGYGRSIPGLQQYGVRAFAEALAVVPKTLAENAGMNFNDVLSNLRSAHTAGKATWGVLSMENTIGDAAAAGIYDSLLAKEWAFKFITEAVRTVLSVDQIIMSKPAGGPKPRDQQAGDAGDD